MPSYSSRDFWLRDRVGRTIQEAQRQERERRAQLRVSHQRQEVRNLQTAWDSDPDWSSLAYLWNTPKMNEYISEETWNILKDQLYEGCTIEIFHAGKNIKGRVQNNNCVCWEGYGESPNMDTWSWTFHSPKLFNPCHPDGTPFVRDTSPQTAVLRKIKTLQTKFKNKTLPKTKIKALPLPT